MQKTQLREQIHGSGFRSVDAPRDAAAALSPFLAVTMFHMSEPTFRPHPHAGFSAVTYLVPESKGAFINRDSMGSRNPIAPGSIHWTQAGAGIVHEEVPASRGVDCWGFQIFVDLAPEHELLAPRAFHAASENIPVVTEAGTTLRIVVGSFGATRSPLQGPSTEVTLLDATLAPDGDLTYTPRSKHNAWFFHFAGSLIAAKGEEIAAPAFFVPTPGDAAMRLRGGPSGARVLIGSGQPIASAKHWAGPFAMSSRERLDAAQRAFSRGELGDLAPSF